MSSSLDRNACLGLDTSCYTTSVALCGAVSGEAEGLFFQARRMLTVPEGGRGLQQSEMVFQHVSRLPGLVEALCAEHPELAVRAVCASVRPRPEEASYMPAFRVGEGVGRSIAAAMRVPFIRTTHQEGHLRAARVGTALRADTPHLALHLSGGTTEVLLVRGGAITLLGGSRDLHAGQLIDRVGVAMGLDFPAGPALSALAAQGTEQARLTSTVQGMDCHFSGAEAQAMRLIAAGAVSQADIAAEVIACIARTVAKWIVAGCAQAGVSDVLLGGGVASSAPLREMVTERVAKRNGSIRLHFARPELAGDNAVGVGLIGLEALQEQDA